MDARTKLHTLLVEAHNGALSRDTYHRYVHPDGHKLEVLPGSQAGTARIWISAVVGHPAEYEGAETGYIPATANGHPAISMETYAVRRGTTGDLHMDMVDLAFVEMLVDELVANATRPDGIWA